MFIIFVQNKNAYKLLLSEEHVQLYSLQSYSYREQSYDANHPH